MGFGGEFEATGRRERTALVSGYGTVSREQLARMERDLAAHRGLGNGGCCEVGEAAGLLFDAIGATTTMNADRS